MAYQVAQDASHARNGGLCVWGKLNIFLVVILNEIACNLEALLVAQQEWLALQKVLQFLKGNGVHFIIAEDELKIDLRKPCRPAQKESLTGAVAYARSFQ